MKVLFLSISRKLAYFLAILVIFFAILVGITRLMIPVLDSHRPELEKIASELLKAPVSIAKARITWYQYQPVITLYEVTAHDQKTHAPILQVEKVRLLLSIPQSLWQKKPILSGVMVFGTEITLLQSQQGEITLQGFPELGADQAIPYQSQTKLLDVLAWVSSQPNIFLQNIDVHYSGLAAQKRFITLYQLHVENAGDVHRIHGKAILHQTLPTEVVISGEWEGKEVDPAKMNAKFYLYVSGFSISQWMKGYTWKDWRINEGVGSAKIWGVLNQGLQRVQTQFQFYNLDVSSTTSNKKQQFARLSGEVGWKQEGDNQIIAGDDILVDRSSSLWPATSFYVLLSPNKNHVLSPKTIQIGSLDVVEAQAFLNAMPELVSAEKQKQFVSLKARGSLQNIKVTLGDEPTDWNSLSFETNFNQLGFEPLGSYPGASNLQGSLKWQQQQGVLMLKSDQATFSLPQLFSSPLGFDQLSGEMALSQDAQKKWQLQLNDLQLLNRDISLHLTGSLAMDDRMAMTSDLAANFTVTNANHVSAYLPMKIFDKGLDEWLNQAFLSGGISSGKIILRGPLNDYPFDKGNGLFQVTGGINNIDLRFAPDWPVLQKIKGTILFENRKMAVQVTEANTMGMPISQIGALIPYLGDDKPAILSVWVGVPSPLMQTSPIEADFSQGLKYVHASPLEKSIGRIFKELEMSGEMQVAFGLTVPLKNPDDTTVNGHIVFTDANMKVAAWKLAVDHLKGQVNFTEKSTDAEKISGQLFSKPIQFNLATIQKNKQSSIVQVSAQNNLEISDLESWLKIPFSKIVKGTLPASLQLDLSFDEPVQLHLQSNLAGLAVMAPKPYNKAANVPRSFAADMTIAAGQPLSMIMSYGDLLGAALVLESKHDAFDLIAANIRLGAGKATLPPSNGLYLSGTLDDLDFDKIKSYASEATSGAKNQFSSLILRGIDITTNSLNVFGQKLSQVQLQIQPGQTNWDVNIISSSVVGSLQLPKIMNSKQTISAQFKRLNLSGGGTSTQSDMDIKNMPAISFDADELTYNGMMLGRVSFKATPIQNGMSIQALTMNSPNVDLRSSGTWTQKSRQSLTALQGEVNSRNVSGFLNGLGINAHNFIVSHGKATFALSWPGAPFAPVLSGLNGHASMELGDGRIVDVAQASGAKMDLGRMLSLFSLQTIPRRLSLNFSDLFQKGYSFDSFKGTFKFSNGDAYTSDTRFDGPVAKIAISGRIGFSEKDYDLTLSVTPYVTSSIPVAATLISGPVIGLAALAVNSVVSSAVSKVTTYYYAVQGPWSNPAWSEVKGP